MNPAPGSTREQTLDRWPEAWAVAAGPSGDGPDGALSSAVARALDDARVERVLLRRRPEADPAGADRSLTLLVARADLTRVDAALRPLGLARAPEGEQLGSRRYFGYDGVTGSWSRIDVATEPWYGAGAPRHRLERGARLLGWRAGSADSARSTADDQVDLLLLRRRAPVGQLWSWSLAGLRGALSPWRVPRGRRGLVVALLGPDGAGKTTLAQGLMQEQPLQARRIYMGTNREAGDSLPVARWVARRRAAIGDQARGFTWLAIKALGFATHLAEEQYRHALARRHRARGGIVVFDRYTLDAHVDARLRRAPTSWTRRLRDALLQAGACKPDLVLILDAPGEVLYARKGEHSPDRLEQMRRAYAALETECPEVVVIDASQDAGAVCRTVTALLWARRCSGRAAAGPPRRARHP